MTPTEVLDSIGQLSRIVCSDGLDLAARTSERLPRCVRIGSQLSAEHLWERANVFLAAVRSVVKLGLLACVAIEVLWFVVT